jgi:hypothetical protein
MLNAGINDELEAAHKALAPAVKRLGKSLSRLDQDTLADMPFGALADLLYDLRQTASQAAHLADSLQEVVSPAVKMLEEYFINSLKVGESSGVQGHKSRVQVTDSPIPTVEDWAALYEYIRKNKAFELLNKAVNRAAVQERWEAKKKVPGINVFHVKKVSCTKLNGKGN